jgi:hypothetical protein
MLKYVFVNAKGLDRPKKNAKGAQIFKLLFYMFRKNILLCLKKNTLCLGKY